MKTQQKSVQRRPDECCDEDEHFHRFTSIHAPADALWPLTGENTRSHQLQQSKTAHLLPQSP